MGWDILRIKSTKAENILRYIGIPIVITIILGTHTAFGATPQLVGELNSIKSLLAQIGPILSAVLFIIAGMFYAIGQMLPPDKRANFHTTAINIIIGAIVIGVLSFTSTSLAVASSHLLSNSTQLG